MGTLAPGRYLGAATLTRARDNCHAKAGFCSRERNNVLRVLDKAQGYCVASVLIGDSDGFVI